MKFCYVLILLSSLLLSVVANNTTSVPTNSPTTMTPTMSPTISPTNAPSSVPTEFITYNSTDISVIKQRTDHGMSLELILVISISSALVSMSFFYFLYYTCSFESVKQELISTIETDDNFEF